MIDDIHHPSELAALLNSDLTEARELSKTGWLYALDADKLQTLYSVFDPRFDAWLIECTIHLGAPTFTHATDKMQSRSLYFEATRLAAWRSNHSYLTLALVQHDKETPIILSLSERAPDEDEY